MVTAINTTQVTSTQTASNSTQTSDILILETCDPRSKYYGKFTDQQALEASKRVNAKEFAGFGYLANDGSLAGIKKFGEAYVKYINQLSPEEQNSFAYKGTKEAMTEFLGQVNAKIASENSTSGKKTEDTRSDLVKMLEKIMDHLKVKTKKAGASTKTVNTADRVTISEKANTNAASLPSQDRKSSIGSEEQHRVRRAA